MLRVAAQHGEPVLPGGAEEDPFDRGQVVERIGGQDLVDQPDCLLRTPLVPQYAGQHGLRLEVSRVFVKGPSQSRFRPAEIARPDRQRGLHERGDVAIRRAAPHQVEVLFDALRDTQGDSAQRPVVARRMVVFVAAERLVGKPRRIAKAARLVVNDGQPAQGRREARLLLQRAAEQLHGPRQVPVLHRVVAGKAQLLGRGGLACRHFGLQLRRRDLLVLGAVAEDFAALAVEQLQPARLCVTGKRDLLAPALAGSDAQRLAEEHLAAGKHFDGRALKRPRDVEGYKQLPTAEGEVDRRVGTALDEPIHVFDGVPVLVPAFLEVRLEDPAIALGEQPARLKLDVLPVLVGEDAFPDQPAPRGAPGPELLAEAVVPGGDVDAAALALVVIRGHVVGRRAAEVVERMGRVLVPADVFALVDRPRLRVASPAGVGVLGRREGHLGVGPGVYGGVRPEIAVVVGQRRVQQQNPVPEARAVGKDRGGHRPLHAPDPFPRTHHAGDASVVALDDLVLHRGERVDRVPPGGEVPLDPPGEPRAPQRHQARLDHVVVVDEVEIVVRLVVRGIDPAADVGQNHHPEVVVFQDDHAVLFEHLVGGDVRLHGIRIHVEIPQRGIFVLRPQRIRGDLQRGLANRGSPGTRNGRNER